MTEALKVAVIGLGEAGMAIAAGLHSAGAQVIGFDSVRPKYSPVSLAPTAQEAVSDADVVLCVSSATQSLRHAQQLASALKPNAIYADLNSGTPELKQRLADSLPADSFVDAAIMQPVADLGHRVPISVSGPAAKRFVEMLEPFGMVLEYVSEVPGQAAAMELLRSIVAKGTAALVIDYLWAADELGLKDWAIAEIKRSFDSSSAADVQAMIDLTARFAKRQTIEWNDVGEMLAAVNYESTTAHGTFATLSAVMHGKRVPFANLDD